MDRKKLEYFRYRLLNEKKQILGIIDQLKDNDMVNEKHETLTELSYYDNHPADNAEELENLEKGLALEKNEVSILHKINEALSKIEDGTYGTCRKCGNKISEERLEFMPYAVYCVNCQNKINEHIPREKNNRPVEEVVLGNPFGYGAGDYKDHVEFDAEDSYDRVEDFDLTGRVLEEYRGPGYVEPIEKISNAQYKAQLPD